MLNDGEVAHILDKPSDYIESREYFSWERYFTNLLIEKTKDTYLAYSKKKLNHSYLSKTTKQAVLNQMEGIQFKSALRKT